MNAAAAAFAAAISPMRQPRQVFGKAGPGYQATRCRPIVQDLDFQET